MQTTRPIANVSISAGYTYQYEVAAVSSQGSLGFSNASKEFRSSLGKIFVFNKLYTLHVSQKYTMLILINYFPFNFASIYNYI